MTEKDELMVLLSIMLLKLSKSGVIVLDIAHNAEHTEVGGFIAKEFRSYLQDEHGIPEVKYNLAVAFKNIAENAILSEDGVPARSYKVEKVGYPGYSVNEVNKGIYIFVLLCKVGAVRFNMYCTEHRELLASIKRCISLLKRVLPWEDAFIAGIRTMDMAMAVGHLQKAATGYSGFLKAVNN